MTLSPAQPHAVSLLLSSVSGCALAHIFDSQKVALGQSVTLSCPRDSAWLQTRLFWIRIVSGDAPEVLGGAYSHDAPGVEPSAFTSQEAGSFVLRLKEAKQSDSGLYYCFKAQYLELRFLKATVLTVEGE